MYYVTPFRYVLSGFLSVAVHGQPVQCGSNEVARFPPPPGQTCESYTASFIAKAGGYVQNGTGGLCEFCQYANGDEFAAGFNMEGLWCSLGILHFQFCGSVLLQLVVSGWVQDGQVGV